jgi:hypothetical protein
MILARPVGGVACQHDSFQDLNKQSRGNGGVLTDAAT